MISLMMEVDGTLAYNGGPAMCAEICCGICKDLLASAHVLQCSHVFCGPCIEQWFEATPEKVCPECRAVSDLHPIRVRALDNVVEIYAKTLGQDCQASLEDRRKLLKHSFAAPNRGLDACLNYFRVNDAMLQDEFEHYSAILSAVIFLLSTVLVGCIS